MVPDPDRQVLICLPKQEAPEAPIASVDGWCTVCAAELWISESVAPAVTAAEVEPVCMACGLAMADADPDSRFELHPLVAADTRKRGLLPEIQAMTSELNRAQRRRRRRR